MQKRRLYSLLECALILAAFLLLALRPREASQAALEGVEICLKSVIPSLFPFFVLSRLLLQRSAALTRARQGGLLSRLFGLPDSCIPAVFLGLLGGYPLGAALSAQLYRQGSCSREEAERLLLFSCGCSPAFVFGLLGGRVFGSTLHASLCWALQLLTSLWLGALLGWGKTASATVLHGRGSEPASGLGAAFSSSLLQGGVSALQVSAYVVFFTVMARFLPEGPLLRGLLEMTGGILQLEGFNGRSAALSALLLGLGGLCVSFQVQGIAAQAGLSTRRWLPCRLLHGAVSALGFWLLCFHPVFFPLHLLLLPAAAGLAKSYRKRRKPVL